MSRNRQQSTAIESTRATNGKLTEPGSVGSLADRIRDRAYQICCARIDNGSKGDALSDWLEAERELKGAFTGQVTPSKSETKPRVRGERLLASPK